MNTQTAKAELEAFGAGRFRLSGVLDAATVVGVLERSRELFRNGSELQVDLSEVTAGDSAGLALLIEWLRMAHARGQRIRFENIPEQICALARISQVEELLKGGPATSNQTSNQREA
ncbi:MAG TPA: STAS domain-containing protein [Steroidobacter sp.]|nr:STAS domain-containing protein [Steroidobacteraceae bacterium]HLS80687.1 STAS domain-containing protein [Steroidobacter sp.]